MAKRRRSGLGSSSATHTAEAVKAASEIEHAAALTVNKARNGRCTAATMAFTGMHEAIGRFDAHNRSGGRAWMPQTAIRDAALEYNTHCVRESTTISGPRARKRRK